MAFVTSLPLTRSHGAPALRTELTGTRVQAGARSVSGTRMGYGDYSYLTDKTKGHVNQYYVDKFRIASDFTKGSPATLADAKLGCNVKNAPLVPTEGIPQEIDPILLPADDSSPPDPRIAESEGAVYSWDVNYVDPQFLPSAYADVDDEDVAAGAFAAFRESVSADRGSSLTAMDFGAEARVQRIKAGLDERYLLTLDGTLDASYARLQKVDDPAVFNPTGTPQTEIPGTPFLRSVGALDFQQKPGESTSFWKETVGAQAPKVFKRPSGADTPVLPYNTPPTVEELKEAQAARGILPAQE